jgi:hypothetical protein
MIAYAVACVEDDPDGNGQDDTYFMSGAGAGNSFGMLGGFLSMFGNPSPHEEGGELVHPMFDGTMKEYLMFLNELYELGTFAPDWYTIEWERNKQYTMNDRLGMVWYPAGALFAEYTGAKQKSTESLDVWHYWAEPPIEGGLYGAAGNPGYLWGFTSAKFDDNPGKLMRVAHMLDTMVYGGENYFQTIQGSIPEVFKFAGIETKGRKEMIYTEDNTFFIRTDEEWNTWIEPTAYNTTLGPWQMWGLSVTWQLSDPENPDPFKATFADRTNTYAQVIAGYDRWPNDGLLITLDQAATDAESRIIDWNNSQQLAFVTGDQSFSDWDAYVEAWLDRGGRDIVASQAASFGVPIPSYAQ